MIYTITLNPSIDYIVDYKKFETGIINRVNMTNYYPGGKGINVSAILHELGMNTVALGFAGGFVGEEIKRKVEELGIRQKFVAISECSRINIKISGKEETEINGVGPYIHENELKLFFEQLKEIKDGDYVVMSGSSPNGISKTIYKSIMLTLKDRNVSFVVDAENELLKNALYQRPFLIKPNLNELNGLFSTKITTKADSIPYLKKLQNYGVKNVLCSFGKDGAVLVTENGCVLEGSVPKGTFKNSVGSGDTMLACFLASYLRNKDYTEALRYSIAGGSASAYAERLANKKEIEELVEKITIRTI